MCLDNIYVLLLWNEIYLTFNSNAITSKITYIMRPLQTDYPIFYKTYIDKVPGDTILDLLQTQKAEIVSFFTTISLEKLNFRYAANKWTPKEILGHITDTERIMAYRALRFSRKDSTPLPGFEENDYVANAHFNDNTMEELIEDFQAVRAASLSLLKQMKSEDMDNKGIANGNSITVNALFYIIYGHALHHVSVIKERYL